MPEAPKPYTAKEYAALAQNLVGRKYILGQPSPYDKPNPSALDCSGLVIWLNLKSGAYKMGDDTAAGLYNRSKAVTGSPTIGDMVFLRNNPARKNGIGHMAVITAKLSNGDWRIVEARGRASGVVNTTLSYWKTRKYYAGIRRLPGFKLSQTSTPAPSKPVDTKFWAGTYNALDTRFGGSASDDGSVIKKMAASVYLLTESPTAVRNHIRSARGGRDRWLVWTRGDSRSQAIMFDKTKYSHTDCHGTTFGPTSYHGAVRAVLTRKDSKKKILFVSLHLPPTSAYTSFAFAEAAREKYWKILLKEINKYKMPVVIGGDFNTESAKEWLEYQGFKVLKSGGTSKTGKRFDWLAVRDGKFTSARNINPGKASDHILALTGHVVVPAASDL